MLRLLNERAKAGVEIKVIGRVSKPSVGLEIRKLAGLRLHTRTIVCDRRQAFVGSQSLRRAELDSRREVGIIVREPKVVSGIIQTFEADWEKKAVEETQASQAKPKVPKKVVKALVKELSRRQPRRVALASCKRLNPSAVSIAFLWQPFLQGVHPLECIRKSPTQEAFAHAGQVCTG